MSEENQETTKDHDETLAPVKVTAPEHELNRVEKHHQNLRDNRVGAPGALHEKSQLFSNKTHYNPHDLDVRISTIKQLLQQPRGFYDRFLLCF
ncbi:hypothetical protein ACVWYN_002074 [Pedobacter sp. UYP24]